MHRPTQTWYHFVYVNAEHLKNKEHNDFQIAKYHNLFQTGQ